MQDLPMPPEQAAMFNAALMNLAQNRIAESILDLSYDLGMNDGVLVGYQHGFQDGQQSVLEYLHETEMWALFSRQTPGFDLPMIEYPPQLFNAMEEPEKELMLIQQQVYFNMPLSVRDNLASKLLLIIYNLGYSDGFALTQDNMISLLEEDDWAILSKHVLTTVPALDAGSREIEFAQ